MKQPESANNRPVLAAIGLILCAAIVALPPLLLWLVLALDILGYALLAGFILILVLTARANLGGHRSSAFFSNNPLNWYPSSWLDRADLTRNRFQQHERTRISGWKAAYQLDYMGALSRLSASDTACAICSQKIHTGNVGNVYRKYDEVIFVCASQDCLKAAAAFEKSDDRRS